ncbi:MAG TPA: PAS domain-containing sensor histidine kinase [Pilimelia sp.]|nr:PAS domain-containing sensor histidine kinase [Pilimelia sp.]
MPHRPHAGRLPDLLGVGAGLIAAVLGAAALAAWAVERPELVRAALDPMPPAPLSGLALVVGGIAVLLLRLGRSRRGTAWCGRGLGLVTAGIGGIGLAERLARAEVGPVREVLAAALGRAAGDAPPPTWTASLGLVLGGLALAAVDSRLHRRLTWTQALAPAAVAIGLVTLLIRLIQGGVAPTAAPLTTLPLLVAGGLVMIGTAAVLVRPREAMLRPFTSLGPGGTVARWLGPALILLPFGVAGVGAGLYRVGVRPPGLVLTLSATMFMLTVALLVGAAVQVLDDADDRQRSLVTALAAERDFTTALLQSLNEGVVVFDRDLTVIDVNARWCRLVGLDRGQLLGQRPPYPWQPPGEANPLPFGAVTGDVDRYVQRPDGTRVPVLASMAPVLDTAGRPRAFVASFVDITDRKRAEEALAGHAAELEGANESLLRTNEQLAEAARFKGDLMSMVSHEVSQPLSSVASLSELLSAEWPELPDDTRRDLAQKIDRNTRRLTTMINDMLLLFRLDAGIVSARRAAVPIGEVVDTLIEARPDAGIVAHVDPDLCALVDRGHLWQVLGNLVDNAARYGQPPIEINTHRTEDEVVVTVRDHGPGIPAEIVPHLFDRFTSARSGTRAKGSGLGLFIVRHLVEVNGGSIGYERAERGARMVIRLPHAQPVPAA